MSNEFKMSPEFLMGLLCGAQKQQKKKPESELTTNDIISQTSKFLKTVFANYDYLTLLDIAEIMFAVSKVHDCCEKICKNHNWEVE